MRCILCKLETGPFNGREHVIPQFLGTFTPQNMLLKEVCDSCNNANGKSFEEMFKRDSMEGMLAAQYQLRSRGEIIIRGERIQIATGDDDAVFDNFFPLLSLDTGVISPDEHVVIMLPSGSRHILLVSHAEFEMKVKRLSEREKSSISIFAPEEKVDGIIQRLRNNGINYQPRVQKKMDDAAMKSVSDRKFTQTIDRTLLRLPAKIVFNYFAWSIREKCGIEAIYRTEFDSIRQFIHTGNGEPPVYVSPSQLASQDGDIPKTHPTHFVVWRKDRGSIVGEVSLFAFLRYQVMLGKLPVDAVIPDGNGFGHVFDVKTQTYKEFIVEIGAPPVAPDGPAFDWGTTVVPSDEQPPFK